MARTTIDHLIINSPYEEPKHHWSYDRESRTFDLSDGRRPAGYVIASQSSKAFDDPGIFVPIPLVNQIRPRVKAWREAGYPGVTGITKRLLEHWNNPDERQHQFFFCQLEAIETIIWLAEAPTSEKVGIDIPSDGGTFTRLCSKMATGSGKTTVMAMLIAWQVINKVTYPQDARFSKHTFVVAPGLTVKSRLQVLAPAGKDNFYDQFNVVPAALLDKLRQGKVLVRNWHILNWESDERIAKKKTVDKRGAKSDEAYVREVLGELASTRNIVVINDEAHHAWRIPAESKVKGVKKEDIEEATKWVGGLDRIQKARGILNCYDFSATPFAPSGKQSSEEALFDWIVSDFGLNDAIESGLVKTPRVVVRDDGMPDAKTYRSKLYHIYEHVKDDLNHKAEEQAPLPDLVTVGYYLLGKDWLETAKRWKDGGLRTPPVMITVANRTETAARVKYAFDHKKILIEELCVPERILHIDSKVLDMAEAQEEPVALNGDEELDDDNNGDDEPVRKLTKKELAEQLRQQVDTIGQAGKPGEQIQKVISVGMLSEGWDARTVTHIMGLRAFSSQLLCEQVVGRGLRRVSYEFDKAKNLFEPEYVNIFGVPFTFLPHEAHDGPPPPPPPPKTKIEPVIEKKAFEISWPNIIRIDHLYRQELKLDLDKVKPLELDALKTPTLAEVAPIVEGKPDVTKLSEIDLEDLGKKFRWQKIAFETASGIFDQMKPSWKGSKEYLLARLIHVMEEFVASGKMQITPPLFNQEDLRRRLVVTLNLSKIVQHLWESIIAENTESLAPIFDTERPIVSTGDMRTWYTGKPCEFTRRSHVNFCVFDST
ncbi:MAG TPA: DEAD/DEAH box helicase family protein [Methylomirabilota bacterium]|nr:DEAD/DEAH box helicase family protein [Methylomirabilota bacterium]